MKIINEYKKHLNKEKFVIKIWELCCYRSPVAEPELKLMTPKFLSAWAEFNFSHIGDGRYWAWEVFFVIPNLSPDGTGNTAYASYMTSTFSHNDIC